jgi:hypothetical protein
MKKLKYLMLFTLLTTHSKIFATDSWILWWVSVESLRRWDIHTSDIPQIIVYAIDFLMWIAWTISIIFIIVWAYQIAIWAATTNDKSKWKWTIQMALAWFVLASLSWIIMKVIISNFT